MDNDEMDSEINFFYESIHWRLENTNTITQWIENCVHTLNFAIHELNYIFCDDEYLWQLNVQHLGHDTYTDVITFDNSIPNSKTIVGDIYISVDRVKENAEVFGVDFYNELCRVMVHGVLHLCGFEDDSDENESQMRAMEDKCLLLLTQ